MVENKYFNELTKITKYNNYYNKIGVTLSDNNYYNTDLSLKRVT